MARPHRKRFWLSFRKAYWLLPPLIGLSIWLTTTWLTDWVLSNAVQSTRQLQTSLYPTTQFTRTLTITAIDARIDRSESIAEITLTTRAAALERLEFKLPLVHPNQLEQALAKDLNVSPDVIRALIQYQIR